jgi:aerobic carbon-monoxide dehydrogenase small subunit
VTDRLRLDLTVNGSARSAVVESRTTLADFLRGELGLTGTHLGCEHGVCGACTVLLAGKPIRSCLLLAVQAEGASITTVEGVSNGSDLHPLQEAFLERASFQCGFCTPGFVMSGVAFLAGNPRPSRAEIRAAVSSNLCRCTGYASIIDAVEVAAERLAGEGTDSDAH